MAGTGKNWYVDLRHKKLILEQVWLFQKKEN